MQGAPVTPLFCAGIHELGDVIGYCLHLMNKMRRNLINLRWNLIKYIQFDGFINDVMEEEEEEEEEKQ